MAETSELTIGIDLGNSFSTVAAHIEGKTYFVRDNRGEACIPSVVYFPSAGMPTVGSYAVRMRQHEPASTVSGIKRVLGRRYDSSEVKVMQASSAVKIRRAPKGTPVLETRAGDHTPTQVAGYIFRHLRDLAEARFRRTVRKVVLTLPASATPDVEHATVEAARLAGLDVLRTITEPHAAALASGLTRKNVYQKLLVYDFGGGTFDVTALDQSEGRLEPLAIGGDGCLGGDDLDHLLAEIAARHVWSTTKVELSKDRERWDRLIREAENTKRALSVRDVAPLRLKGAFYRRGRERDLEMMIHRKDAEVRWEALIRRSLSVTARTMVVAGLKPKDLGTTLLIGGTTLVPSIAGAVKRLMGESVTAHSNPQTAVAEGAAIAAARTLSRAA